VWVGLALALALIYRFSPWFDKLKEKAVDISTPLYWVSDLPTQAGTWADNRFMSRTKIVQENNALRSEMLVLRQTLQKNAALEAENLRLRQLLNASDAISDHVLIAELIGVTPDPQVHKVIINRGSNDDVYVGQAVLDAFGLMGQVVEVGERSSVVLLITDASHALPVQVNRNGVRLVAEGVGDLYSLQLRHVANTLDIVEGDLLVSSGLGQRFPAGSRMNRSRHLLLVFETTAKDG